MTFDKQSNVRRIEVESYSSNRRVSCFRVVRTFLCDAIQRSKTVMAHCVVSSTISLFHSTLKTQNIFHKLFPPKSASIRRTDCLFGIRSWTRLIPLNVFFLSRMHAERDIAQILHQVFSTCVIMCMIWFDLHSYIGITYSHYIFSFYVNFWATYYFSIVKSQDCN